MPMFRKKPVVVEARLVTQDNIEDVAAWAGARVVIREPSGVASQFTLPTSKGDEMVSLGDYVVCGVEFFSCKPGTFQANYEAIEEVGTVGATSIG